MIHQKQLAWGSVAVVLCGVLGACESGKKTADPADTAPKVAAKTEVISSTPRGTGKTSYASLTIKEGTHTAEDMPEDVRMKISRRLEKRLHESGAFATGDDLTLTYSVLDMNKGSRTARYWSSGFGGKGKLHIKGVYTDKAGVQVADCVFEGEVKGGWYGGDFDNALDSVANQMTKFTVNKFK